MKILYITGDEKFIDIYDETKINLLLFGVLNKEIEITINIYTPEKILFSIQGFLENQSIVKLRIQNANYVESVEYEISGRILLVNDSKATISPIIQSNGINQKVSHSISIGRVEQSIIDQLKIKGFSEKRIYEIMKEGINNS